MPKPPDKDYTLLLKMMAEQVSENKKGVATLYEIICKGYEGNQPLLARVIVLEKVQPDLEKRVQELEDFYLQFKVEDKKSRRNFTILLVGSLIGWSTDFLVGGAGKSIIQWFVSLIKSG